MKNPNLDVEKLKISGIPSLIWGNKADKVYIHVHGKMSCKEFAKDFAEIAEEKGYQTLSFDLPEHGERSGDHEYRCDIWNGPRDLRLIADYAFSSWQEVCLYGSSIGAFFSLNAYASYPFRRCLFQSPIWDMEYLVKKMMEQFGVTEKDLREKGEIPNPIDPLRWDYYQYVKTHPITEWRIPTAILYGEKDWFQSQSVVQRFSKDYHCHLTVAPDSEHAFMEKADAEIVRNWYRKEI